MPIIAFPTDWPAETDVEEFLTSTGLFAAGLPNILSDLSAEVTTELQAAIQQIQEWTRWMPFLAAEQTRLFDPPGPEKGPAGYFAGLNTMGGSNRLFLNAGLLSLTDGSGNPATTITVGLTAEDTVGETLTLGRDFWLMPGSAPQYDRPYTSVKFRTLQFGEPQSISITGLWGFGKSLPPGVFRAVVKLAAAALAPQIDLHINQGKLSRKAGDEEDRYSGGKDAGPVANAASQWRADAEALLTRGNYRRVSL